MRHSQVKLLTGDYFVDGPLFLKSGVSFDGSVSDDSPNHTYLELYQGENNGKTYEDAMFVIDGGTGRNASVDG